MTHEHDFDEHPEIRDLLGSLDDDGVAPMPPEVRARLNAVIKHAAAQRQTSSPGRNLRRLGVAWIGGAAAVLALATGGGYAIQQLAGDTASESTSGATSSTESATDPGSADDGPADADQSAGPTQLQQLRSALPRVRAATFAEDALAAARTSETGMTADRVEPEAANRVGCAPLRAQRQGVTVVNVLYGSNPAVLMVDERPPPVATLYDCEGVELRSAELPAAP